MSQLSKIVEQLMNIVAIAFAIGLFIYDAQHFDIESGYSYISIGGVFSLLVILGYLNFTRFKIWLESEFMGHNIGYLWLVMTYAFFFAVASLYYFSTELYNEYQNVSQDQETLILNGLGILGSLATVILLSPYAFQSIAITFMFLIFQPYMIIEYLTKQIKKIR